MSALPSGTVVRVMACDWQAWVTSDAAFALFPEETHLPDTAKDSGKAKTHGYKGFGQLNSPSPR